MSYYEQMRLRDNLLLAFGWLCALVVIGLVCK